MLLQCKLQRMMLKFVLKSINIFLVTYFNITALNKKNKRMETTEIKSHSRMLLTLSTFESM